jgi:hypothetical protein
MVLSGINRDFPAEMTTVVELIIDGSRRESSPTDGGAI